MSDPLANALARLAPAVDLGASRELFERARDGGAESEPPSPRDRHWMLVASVLLLVIGVIGVWVVAGRDGNAPAVTPAGEPGTGNEFRVVAREPVDEGDTRRLRAADTPDDLDALVQPYGADLVIEASAIDLATDVALVIVRNGNSCPDELARFEPTGDEWVAVWEEQGGDCEDIGLGWVYLVAVERSALIGIQWFVDPAQQQGPLSWDELRVAVPGTSTPPPPTSVPEIGRPALPTPDELAARLGRFPMANPSDPADLAALIAAHGRQLDWTGTLSGLLFHSVPSDEWWMCWEILESLPEQCGSGIRLAAVPKAYTARPDDFDEQRAADSDEVAVVISRAPQEVTGTWFDDAAIFVEAGSSSAGTADVIDVGGPAATGDEFTLIAREAVGDISRRRISVASTEDALRALLDGYRDGFERWADEVNFALDIAVVIERFGNPCPPDIARFLPSDGAWRVQWAPPGEDVCETAGLGWVYVVAVERSALANVDTILLPADPAFDAPEIGAAVRDASIGPIVTTFAAGGIDGTMPAQNVTVFTEPAAWDRYAAEHFGGSPEAAIGLDRYVVVVFRFADDDDECARAIDRFDVAGDVWTPVFAAAAGTCDAGPITTTHAVAVERSALPDRVTFALALDESRGLPATSVTVDVARPEDSRASFDEVLSSVWNGEPSLIGVGTSRASLQAIWAAFGVPDELPVVNFDRDVAVVFTVDDETCRATFDGFDRGPGTPYPTWLVRFAAPDSSCAPTLTTLHVVAVRREAIAGGVVFALPPGKQYGAEDARVAVDPGYSIFAALFSCGPTDQRTFGMTLDLPDGTGVDIDVLDGETVIGRGSLRNAEAGTFSIEFGTTGSLSPTMEAVVTETATGTEVARIPAGGLDIQDCG